MEAIIQCEDIYFSYEEEEILKGLSFKIYEGQMGIILGENASGKSTIFKLIAGLIKPQKGNIIIEGVNIVELKEEDLNNIRKKMGIIFQESALFDSLSVRDNVAYPLYEREKLDEEEIERRVREVLRWVELEEAIDKFPAELSGGMKKRVAIARALISYPKILLYDDPTAGLDPIISRSILKIIIKLRDIRNITSLIITNQFEEAVLLATLKAEVNNSLIHYKEIKTGIPNCQFFLLENGKFAFTGSLSSISDSNSLYLKELVTVEGLEVKSEK